MSSSINTVSTLFRYWMKGRITKPIVVWMIVGECFGLLIVLFVGSTFLSFSSKFNLGGGISDASLSLLFAFFLVGMIQSGFNGSGLPVSSADVDYVFTSPVKPSEVYAAKIAMNSLTTVILSFPPTVALYLRFSQSYGVSPVAALLAGAVSLGYFVVGLFLSADITLSLNSKMAPRLKLLRNGVMVAVVAISLVPLTLLIPGMPAWIAEVVDVLPSGLAAEVSFGLVSRGVLTVGDLLALFGLAVWFVAVLGIGVRLSRAQFYEVLQVEDPSSNWGTDEKAATGRLDTTGRSVWAVVRAKERVMMNRTKETRSMLINTLFLAGFMVIYSLSGVFQSSPTSFLFILFIIGSFGSGNAARWLEKERLWIIKTSSLDLKRYVREAYRARVTPLLLLLSPVTIAVGIPLLLGDLKRPASLIAVGLSLPGALEVAAVMMAGGMYFAAKYGQSTADDLLASQGQDLTDVKRFLYQTIIGLVLVAPLMGLVLASSSLLGLAGTGSLIPLATLLAATELGYTIAILSYLLGAAGGRLQAREDI